MQLDLDAGASVDSNANLAWGRNELADDVAAQLGTALHHAYAVAADGVSRVKLAGRSLGRLMDRCNDGQAMPNGLSMDLYWPDEDQVRVQVTRAESGDSAPNCWTLLRTNRPVREPSGAQHLALQGAMETIADVLDELLHPAPEPATTN